MKESVGYTVSLNIMIIFITVIIAFLCAALIYFKSNKVSNVIINSIEKYEGYNDLSISEINRNLTSLGYNRKEIKCATSVTEKINSTTLTCKLTTLNAGRGSSGYCVYECFEPGGEYYYYKTRTNMMINIPIIHDILDIPIYSNTNRLYDFANKIEDK